MKRETTPEMYSHQQKENIKDGSNGDIYVNQYHRYKLSGAAGALSLKGTPYQMASEVVQLLKCSLGNIHGVDSKGLFQGLWPRGCCVWTLYKALQRKGHLVEIILPKFDCMQYEHVTDLKGTTAASELSSCGLDVPRLKRPDRMEDNSEHDKVNPIKICGMTDNSLYITMGPFPSLLLREKS